MYENALLIYSFQRRIKVTVHQQLGPVEKSCHLPDWICFGNFKTQSMRLPSLQSILHELPTQPNPNACHYVPHHMKSIHTVSDACSLMNVPVCMRWDIYCLTRYFLTTTLFSVPQTIPPQEWHVNTDKVKDQYSISQCWIIKKQCLQPWSHLRHWTLFLVDKPITKPRHSLAL